MPTSRLLSFFKAADWLDAERVRIYCWLLLAISAAGFAIWISLSHGLIDRRGTPLGADFMSFYAASKLTLAGHGALAWDPYAHQAAEDAIFGRHLGYWAFFYPPAYLLLCAPLALLPYGAALLLWLTTTSAAAIALVERWMAKIAPERRVALIPLLAFPALWINLGNGQNAALTTALFAGGCLLLDRRPIIAGLILGLLIIKPQLGLALPLILIAAACAVPARWKTFLATGLSALALCGAGWLLVGTDGYLAFMHNSALARATLEQGLVSPDKMQSLFAALKLFGAPNALAYTAQGLLALGVIITAARTAFRHRPDGFALGALIVAATPLLSPFLLDYDLLMTALPLSWLILNGLRHGFRPWEKFTALCVFVLPIAARALALNLHLPLTPFVLLAFYTLVVRRIAQVELGGDTQ